MCVCVCCAVTDGPVLLQLADTLSRLISSAHRRRCVKRVRCCLRSDIWRPPRGYEINGAADGDARLLLAAATAVDMNRHGGRRCDVV